MSGFQYLPQPVTLFLIYYIFLVLLNIEVQRMKHNYLPILWPRESRNPGSIELSHEVKKKNACINAS